MQAPLHLLFGGVLTGPQGFAQVGVKADEFAVLFGIGHGGPGGRAGRFVGQAQGTEVKDLAAVQQGGVQLVGAQTGVGAGLAGEAEGPVAGGVQRDEGQGGEHRGIDHDAPGINAQGVQGAHQQMAEGIVPHLAQQGGGTTVFLQCGQEIARRAARLGLEGGIPALVGGYRGEVDQQLAQGNNIFHSKNLPQSSVRRACSGKAAAMLCSMAKASSRRSYSKNSATNKSNQVPTKGSNSNVQGANSTISSHQNN